jgi:hypothetical protein
MDASDEQRQSVPREGACDEAAGGIVQRQGEAATLSLEPQTVATQRFDAASTPHGFSETKLAQASSETFMQALDEEAGKNREAASASGVKQDGAASATKKMKVPMWKGVAAKIAMLRAILAGLLAFVKSPRASVRSWYGDISASAIDLNFLRARDFATWIICVPSIALDITSAVLLFTQQKDGGVQAALPVSGNGTYGAYNVTHIMVEERGEMTTGDKVASRPACRLR